MDVCMLKTGKGILRRMQRVLATPYHQRRAKFGKAWVFEIVNGEYRIREEFPELVADMVAILQQGAPQTVDDLVSVYP